jgi:cob(I)alamin adenosyltransferase
MTKIISISTKKGDEGESYLANGQKLPKDHLVFEVLGNIDELNSHLGLVAAQLHVTEIADKLMVIEQLEDIQSSLYLLSGIIAKAKNLKFPKSKLERIEKLGDTLQVQMVEGWTTKFLYPGGSIIGAKLDISRSVARRCERLVVTYSKQEKLNPVVLQYINRLSDFLFILRCFMNQQFGIKEKQFSKSK